MSCSIVRRKSEVYMAESAAASVTVVEDPEPKDRRTNEWKAWAKRNAALEAGGSTYADPASFYASALPALLASGVESRNLIAFGKQAWVDYKALVDWARTDGA